MNKIHKFLRLTPSVYNGRVKACILDWSGTTADAHVLAPAVAFVDAFKKHGVEISMKEAREPMGLRKDLHIKKILEIPEVNKRWFQIKGNNPTDNDAENIFNDFVPMQLECLPKYSTLIPGVPETINRLRNDYNIKIGSTTGFTKNMVDVLLEKSKEQGYVPDSSVAGDEVANDMGVRPKPFMIYQNLLQLKISPIQSVVKVDDTVSGVGEGLNAGCWAVGIAGLSNYTDIDSLEQWEEMSSEERRERVEQSREILLKSGAHYVIDDFTSLPDVIDDINIRLSNCETP
jgi:phosphonoacetaldehyde hydrolase